jgi:hypothetical protein
VSPIAHARIDENIGEIHRLWSSDQGPIE